MKHGKGEMTSSDIINILGLIIPAKGEPRMNKHYDISMLLSSFPKLSFYPAEVLLQILFSQGSVIYLSQISIQK